MRSVMTAYSSTRVRLPLNRFERKVNEEGLRVRLVGRVGVQAKVNVQLDLGFTDTITLPSAAFEYPTLLDEYPPPILRAYSPESIIAEKFEAIASLDQRTTRYKDYDDILVSRPVNRVTQSEVDFSSLRGAKKGRAL